MDINAMPATVSVTMVGSVRISTVLMPSFRNSGEGHAETRIFLNDGPIEGLENRDEERGPVGDAQEQHDRWVAKVKAAVAK